MHPFAFGVTVIVAITGVIPVFVVAKLGILPLPDAARPIDGVSFVQSKVVPFKLLVKGIVPLAMPLHFTRLVIELTLGRGLTVILNVLDKPVQLLAAGVTVTVAITGVKPVLIAVNDGMELLPEAAIPMLVLFEDQL